MNPKITEALSIVAQVCDQAPMTGPQRRLVDAALATLQSAITPPPPAPAAKDSPANEK